MVNAGEDGAEEIVARADPDRYVASLFAPAERRRGLIALYHFNLDVARIRDVVHEPLVGHIRLGWWREQIASIYEQRATAAPLGDLRSAIEVFALPRELFDAYLDARALDLSQAPFGDEAALEVYTGATAGSLMKLAARVCGAGGRADLVAHHAAIAGAYAGFTRSLGFDAAHRFCRLPLAWLEDEGLNDEDVFAAKITPKLGKVVERLASAARRHLLAARAERFPSQAAPALAPAALVASYLNRAMASNYDVFGKPTDVPQFTRIARIALVALTRRL